MDPRPLRIAAHTELVSLVVMLANIATAHLRPVSALMGPVHGCAYLVVVVATWRLQQATASVKTVSLVPGIGGLLALRRLDRADSAHSRPAAADGPCGPPP
ncbi:DUF3817 domain-containing protein [Streptomyces sp. NPDC003023]|uniref:DUF3817 domain-containing protein n=1 Tax=Streptomyces sp. NPDC003023 TaxID=3364675 RepID=UPI0036B8B08F